MVQASAYVYDANATRYVSSARSPVDEEVICASLGGPSSYKVDCGTVSDDWTYWYSSYCACNVWGGAYRDITSWYGDSGSPMYRLYREGYQQVIALGLLATGTKFAHVQSAINYWGVSVVTQ